MRERWFGATGKQVPQIAVEGEIEFPEEPLLLDSVSDTDLLQREFDEGRAIVVRADSPEKVMEALSRPEVACVIVPAKQRELLDLDLVELTYGS